MDLSYRIKQYYDEKNIRIEYDPKDSIFKTWYGRHIPVIFDGDAGVGEACYRKDKKEIYLNPKYNIEKLADDLIHEAGYANFSTGSSVLTDISMIPSVYASAKLFEHLINRGINPVIAAILPLCTVMVLRYFVSEFIAESYSLSKKLLRNIKSSSLHNL